MSTSPTTDAISQWNTALRELLDSGLSRRLAVRKLVARDPKLREEYVEAYNSAARAGLRPGATRV